MAREQVTREQRAALRWSLREAGSRRAQREHVLGAVGRGRASTGVDDARSRGRRGARDHARGRSLGVTPDDEAVASDAEAMKRRAVEGSKTVSASVDAGANVLEMERSARHQQRRGASLERVD